MNAEEIMALLQREADRATGETREVLLALVEEIRNAEAGE